jgi:hypothetical protein
MRRLIALLMIAGFGLARLPFEQKLAEDHRAAFFHGEKLTLNLRQQVGQFGFLAALSGFRSIVADLLWIKAYAAWENTEWGRMTLLFNTVTTLQPRVVMFWDMAAWHMAWNASLAAYENPKQPRQALRIKAQREYFELGKDFLLRGIQNNPDRYQLYERLAYLYKEKYNDPAAAAENYARAARFDNAPGYLKRFALYELSYCPGREREAYEKMKALYNQGENERLPTLLARLRFLQEKLQIPEEERLNLPPLPGP